MAFLMNDLGTWVEPDPEVVEYLWHSAIFAADAAISKIFKDPAEHMPSYRTDMAVRAAIRMLLANGMITAADRPDWVRVDAPDS